MPDITASLVLDKTTAGTFVYKEPSGQPRAEQTFPTIYLQKHALPDPPPQQIVVTVSFDE